MHLAHQSERDWQGLQALQAMLKSGHVIAHFAQIIRASFASSTGFCGEQLAQCRLCAFDAARKYSLLAEERSDQQVGVG